MRTAEINAPLCATEEFRRLVRGWIKSAAEAQHDRQVCEDEDPDSPEADLYKVEAHVYEECAKELAEALNRWIGEEV